MARVGELDRCHRLAPIRQRFLQRDRPGCAAGFRTAAAHLAVDADEPARQPEAVEDARHLIDAKALGDARQIELERRPLARAASGAVKLQQIGGCGASAGKRDDRGGVSAARGGAEAPCLDETADADVERPVGVAPDVERRHEHGHQFLGQRHPIVRLRLVEPHEIGVGLPGRHLAIDPVDGCGERHLDRSDIQVVCSVKDRGPARAHGRPVQAGTRQGHGLSRHLRDTFHRTSAPLHRGRGGQPLARLPPPRPRPWPRHRRPAPGHRSQWRHGPPVRQPGCDPGCSRAR